MLTLPGRLGSDLHPRRGAAIVEFALILTLVSALVFGAIEVMALVNNRLTLESAARDGARRAAIAGGDSTYVRERIDTQLQLGNIPPERVQVSIDPWRVPYGQSIRVRLSYDSPTLTPIGRGMMGSAIRLTTEVLTRSEKIQ